MGVNIGEPRPSRDQILLGTAKLFAMRSTCARQHTGAVVAYNGRILSTGYNGAPEGYPHCVHENPMSKDPADACKVSVHAELNAIAFAARCGNALEGAELFCTHQPCLPCAQAIINSGIKRVVFDTAYRDISGINLLQSVGIETMGLCCTVVL